MAKWVIRYRMLGRTDNTMAKWVIRYRMSRKDRQYNGQVGNQISYV